MDRKKIIYSLLFIVFLILPFSIKAQNEIVTLSGRNITLKSAFEQIEKQTKLSIDYDANIIDVNQKIKSVPTSDKVSTVLDLLLKETGYVYKFNRSHVIITASPNPVSEETNPNKTITVRGLIIDRHGDAIIGANIILKGTSTGTISDMNGEFTIQAPRNGILQITYIGYEDKEVRIDGKTSLKITIEEDTKTLDEIVVVGYGTQKRGNLTGSIASIKGDEIKKTPHTSLAQSLQGKVSGLQIRQQAGEPGEFSNMINIRGFGAPLIVIDGIVRNSSADFQKLKADDIESISILKDASAAIYGLNAGNGVILVTTKKGIAGKTKVTVNALTGANMPTDVPKMLNAAQYMEMRNDANINAGSSPYITKEELNKWQTGGMGYESTDWYNETMKKYALQRQYNITAEGGGKEGNYFISIGHTSDNGLYKSNDLNYSQYSLRSNVGLRINENLNLEVRIAARHDQKDSPRENFWTIFRGTRVSLPTDRPYANNNTNYPNDISPASLNPLILSEIDYVGYSQVKNKNFQSAASLNYLFPFVKGLSLKGTISYDSNNFIEKNLRKTYDLFTYSSVDDTYISNTLNNPAQISNTNGDDNKLVTQSQLSYKNNFNETHFVDGTLVFETSKTFYRYSWLQRDYDFYTNDQINLAGLNNQRTDGYETETASMSLVGRFNYSYKNKYLVEFAFRNDGTYRYAPKYRWGFFPVISGGWRISEENFIKDNCPIISNLKLRGSYGLVGQNAGEPFQYILGFTTSEGGKGYEFSNGSYTNGITAPGVVNEDLTWYTANIRNVGLELNLANGLLNFEFDLYQRDRKGLLATRNLTLPNTYGTSLPQENLNTDRVQGFDFSVGHINKIGDFEYGVNFNFNFARTKNIYVERAEYRSSWDKWRNGNTNRWNDIEWGYQQIGQFQNEEEVLHSPIQGGALGNSKELPGDYMLQDTNGDGVVNDKDVLPLFWNGTPKLFYGITINAAYKNFDFNILLQGSGNYSLRFGGVYGEMFAFKGNSPEYFYDRWHKADPYDSDSEWIPGKWPAARLVENVGSMYATTDVWRKDASYLRIKSVELGYNLPSSIAQKLFMQNLRLYINAYNLYTFADSFVKPFDPEKIEGLDGGNAGFTYPLTKSYNLGLTISF